MYEVKYEDPFFYWIIHIYQRFNDISVHFRYIVTNKDILHKDKTINYFTLQKAFPIVGFRLILRLKVSAPSYKLMLYYAAISRIKIIFLLSRINVMIYFISRAPLNCEDRDASENSIMKKVLTIVRFERFKPDFGQRFLIYCRDFP